MSRSLSLFTLLPLEEVSVLCASTDAAAQNLAKEILAFAVTSLRHGAEAAAAAAANARGLFGGYDEAFRSAVVQT